MQAQELERYIHHAIPLSRAMDMSVLTLTADTVVLRAPLAPNINHRDTVFGGSASALAILAAWSLLHTRLLAEDMAARLVIQRNTMEYERPIAGAFSARAVIDDEQAWQRFTRMLARKGKARIGVGAVLEYDGEIAGRLNGEFVALGAESY